jgi:hypothetical protein
LSSKMHHETILEPAVANKKQSTQTDLDFLAFEHLCQWTETLVFFIALGWTECMHPKMQFKKPKS